jgi:ketosteroid isomerase-like protein
MAKRNLEIVREMYERREGGDRILVLETQSARGARSGAEISQDVGALLTLRDGLIVRWEYYWERSDALEAAGIAQ